jgi:hypothetical protein
MNEMETIHISLFNKRAIISCTGLMQELINVLFKLYQRKSH